jgi:hypothetical protein
MTRTKWLIVVGAVVVASASAAYAGLRQQQLLVITNLGSGYFRAVGALGSVRNRVGNIEYLWCRIEAGETSTSGNMIFCSAKDSFGVTADCCMMDTSGTLTAAIAAMNGDSVVTFEVSMPQPAGQDGGTDAGGDAGAGSTTGSISSVLATATATDPPSGSCTRLKIQNDSSYPGKTKEPCVGACAP